MLFAKEEKWSSHPPYLEARVNFADANDDLDVTECKFQKVDKGVLVLFALKNIKCLNKSEQYTENQLFSMLIHNEKYEVWTKENPKTPTEPTDLELLLLDIILEKEFVKLDTLYTGTLSFNSGATVLNAVKKKEAYDVFFALEEKEGDPDFLKAAVEGKNGFGKGGYAKGQTEYEKLTDRTDWLMVQCGQPKGTLLKDFDPTTVESISAVMSFIFQ